MKSKLKNKLNILLAIDIIVIIIALCSILYIFKTYTSFDGTTPMYVYIISTIIAIAFITFPILCIMKLLEITKK